MTSRIDVGSGVYRRDRMSCAAMVLLYAMSLLIGFGEIARAGENGKADGQAAVREVDRVLYVPFEDLPLMLGGKNERVFLAREEYAELQRLAAKRPRERAPRAAWVVSASYDVSIDGPVATFRGELEVEVLEPGWHRVALGLAHVRILRATLDGQPAPLAHETTAKHRAQGVALFVHGRGRKKLELVMQADVAVSAAIQTLAFSLPVAGSTTLKLKVPGNVDIKSGAKVASRVYDGAKEETVFELLPVRGLNQLAITVNNRRLRKERLVVARSVLISHVAANHEEWEATISLDVLHGVADRFQFGLPRGFQVTAVESARMTQWAIEETEGQRLLEVRMRESIRGVEVVRISATRSREALDNWQAPRLMPRDVVSHVAVLGVMAERGMKPSRIKPTGLIPLDIGVIRQATAKAEVASATARFRPLFAFFASGDKYSLAAEFERPAAKLRTSLHLMWQLGEEKFDLWGGFTVSPEGERASGFTFHVPHGWKVREVKDEQGNDLSYRRFVSEDRQRLVVRFPRVLEPGESQAVLFHATRLEPRWFDLFEELELEFPAVVAENAVAERGALAVKGNDDVTILPGELKGLQPLDAGQRAEYGLDDRAGELAYEILTQPFVATFRVRRRAARWTARTYSFFKIDDHVMHVRYELFVDVSRSRIDRLQFALPKETPVTVSIVNPRVRSGFAETGPLVRETESRVEGAKRIWTVHFDELAGGRVLIWVAFEQSLDTEGSPAIELPMLEVVGAAYQSDMVAVEGAATLDVTTRTRMRPVDVGELAEATYIPQRHLLGVFASTPQERGIVLKVRRRELSALPPAIVQRAEIVTVVSGHGTAQTAARYLLKTKVPLLGIRLPAGATLWSVTENGEPVQPAVRGKQLLLNLKKTGAANAVDVRLVYETSAETVNVRGTLDFEAPRLWLMADDQDSGTAVPQADLVWHVHLPRGYRVVSTSGNVFTHELPAPEFPFRPVAATLGKTILPLFWSPLLLGMAERSGARIGAVDEEIFLGSEAESSPHEKSDAGAGEMYDLQVDREFPPPPAVEATEAPNALAPRRDAPAVGGGGVAGMGEGDMGGGGFGAGPGRTRGSLSGGYGLPEDVGDIQESGDAEQGRPEDAKAKKKYSYWALQGLKGVSVEFSDDGEAIDFRSLGETPRLEARVVDAAGISWLAWSAAAVVFAYGLAISRKSMVRRLRWVAIVWTLATLLASVGGWVSAYGDVYAMSAIASALLVPLWCVWGGFAVAARWLQRVAAWLRANVARVASTSLLLLLLIVPAFASAQEPLEKLLEELRAAADVEPLLIPDDAVVVPYDPARPERRNEAQRVLVPYRRYVELWNAAHPDKKIGDEALGIDYAFSGVRYEVRLGEGDHLQISGELAVEVLSDGVVEVPLALRGAVITAAELDGRPAPLQAVLGPPPLPVQASKERLPARPVFVRVRVSGRGMHRVKLEIELPVRRQGGWRQIDAVIPHGPATEATVTVPEAETRLRRSLAEGSFARQTERPNESVSWVVDGRGRLALAWRGPTMPGSLDRSLTANSQAVVDVVSDGVRVAWRVALGFGRQERGGFEFVVPDGYIVERVTGANVRGWQVVKQQERRILEVELLKGVKEREELTVFLLSRRQLATGESTRLPVPYLELADAALHRGVVALRKSRVLRMTLAEATGVSRVEQPVGSELAKTLGAAIPGPLGVEDFRSFEFRATPFRLELDVSALPAERSVVWRTLLRIGESQAALESQAVVRSRGKPIHELTMLLPIDLQLERVDAPGLVDWALRKQESNQALTVFLGTGQVGEVPITIVGRLADHAPDAGIDLPQLRVLGVERQSGFLVVQADPAIDVRAEQVAGLQTQLMRVVSEWLAPQQRKAVRLVWSFADVSYSGVVQLQPRKPEIRCDTVTNIRVTYREIQQTILLDFDIRRAGAREIVFELPRELADAEIVAPMIRQKHVTDVEGDRVRVRLELQDAVMGQYRVMVSYDRGLASGRQRVPLPIVKSGSTTYRYVTLENAGRDELEVEGVVQFQPLQRGMEAWDRLKSRLARANITLAYVTTRSDEEASIAFAMKRRQVVETAGANIGLARTTLVVDAAGAYRAVIDLRVDNRTESVLEIELPKGSELWAAIVAGEPIKPIKVGGARAGRRVRIPLIKTAEGDLDYSVELKYAGVIEQPRTGKQVEFPFIRTINIKVERSQVELWLPDEFNWVYFDSTATRVASKEDFVAGYVTYRQRQLERLSQVLRGKNWFSSMRALYNAKSLVSELSSLKSKSRRYSSSIDQSQSMALQVIAEAEQQVEESSDELPAATGNRAALGQLVESQQNDFSRNEVLRMHDNFQAPVKPQRANQAGTDIGRLDVDWFEHNKLAPKRQRAQDLPDRADNSAPSSKAEVASRRSGRGRDAKQAQEKKVAANVFQLAQPKGKAQQGQQAASVAKQAEGREELKEAYKQRLEGPSDGDLFGRGMLLGGAHRRVRIDDIEGDGDMQPLVTSIEPVVDSASPGLISGERGLASLDFELPTRGRAYYFETPRGDVEIAARAVPSTWGVRGASWRVTAVVLAALWGCVLLVARWRPSRATKFTAAWFTALCAGIAILLLMPLMLCFFAAISVQLFAKASAAR